jgi:hypothetical protein
MPAVRGSREGCGASKILCKEPRDPINVEAEEGYDKNHPKRDADCQGSESVATEYGAKGRKNIAGVQRRPKACLNGQFTSPVSALCGKASIWMAKTLDIKDNGS